MRNKKQKGFTLIELLVVIAIIGLLASVVLLALNSARAKSRDAKRIADIRQLASAMELFFNDKNSYPTANVAFAVGTAYLLSDTTNGVVRTDGSLVPSYIGMVPSAPGPADSTACSATYAGHTGNDYLYFGNGTANTTNLYTISFCLGAATGGYSAGLHDLTPAGIQ